jgi:DNA-binding LacI/PurR family transcriptional regulator
MQEDSKITIKAATLKDVALRVGVNPTTAAVVLNRTNSGTKVSEKTRNAILEAARELGYRPNSLARSLRRGKTGLIGVYSGYRYLDTRNPFIAELLAGIEEACAERGLDVLLHTAKREASDEELLQGLSDGRIDGLLMISPAVNPLGRMVAESHLPAVAISEPFDLLPSVVADDSAGGRLQIEHLHERGHRCVLFRGATHELVSATRRREALYARAAELGVEVVEVDRPGRIHVPQPQREWLTAEEQALLQRKDNPATAIVCWEDHSAFITAGWLEANGFGVPRDIAVVGYNGIAVEYPTQFNLTTIDAHWSDVARKGVDLLTRRLRDEEVAPHTVLPVHLVPGSTT